MIYFLLDIFPLELTYRLFNHFCFHEIFYRFTNVSCYIDNILVTYRNHCVNFKSRQFELICKQILSEDVVSLIL